MKVGHSVTSVDEERSRILAAAAQLFERYGYKKTTVEDIALEAGIGKGSVYLRFTNKEEIGIAWLQSLHEGLFEEITDRVAGTGPDEALRQVLVSRVIKRFDIFSRHRRSLDEAVCSLRPQLEDKKKAVHEREAAHIAGLIQEGTAAGTMRSADALGDARTMVLATNSLLPYAVRTEQIGDRDTVLDQATAMAGMLVRAVEAPRG